MYEIFKPIWISVWGIVFVIGVIKTIKATDPDDLKTKSSLILYSLAAFAGIGFADILRQIL